MKSCRILVLSWTSLLPFVVLRGIAAAQETPAPANTAPIRDAQQAPPATPAALRLTLEDALARPGRTARNFKRMSDASLAAGTSLARDALAPQRELQHAVSLYPGQWAGRARALHRQQSVHEYISQGNVHQILDLTSISNYRRVSAVAAAARARAEVASRDWSLRLSGVITLWPPHSRTRIRPNSSRRRRPLLQTHTGP